MQKIYFDNRVLYITAQNNPTLDAVAAAKGTVVLQNRPADEIVQHMQDKNTTAVIWITPDLASSFGELRNKFTVIQAAGGFVTNQHGDVLFIFRRGYWDLPKGKRDEGESLETCALREVEEETGVTGLAMVEKILVTWHTYTEKESHILKETHWYRLHTNETGLLSPQQDEGIEQCKWVAAQELHAYIENTYGAIVDVVQAASKKQY